MPPEEAQHVTGEMINAGIRAILNFAPVNLEAAKGIHISNVDMACELETLVYSLKSRF